MQIPAWHMSQAKSWKQVKAFALNRMDILQREGKYPVAVNVSPILGVEVSGTVESVGKDGMYDFDLFL